MRRRIGMQRIDVSVEDVELITLLGRDAAFTLIDELPPDQRDAVREHVLDDRPYGDIALDRQTSEAVIRKRVSRGLGALRSRMGARR
jgi:RNA polymerase sigma-70 factor (ECF subfamily)